MKKRILSLALALIMSLALLPAAALAADSDFTIENGVLTRYKGSSGNVVIPNGVTSIGDYAFQENKSITGVTIPAGVTEIGSGAFLRCEALASVTIPDSVTTIGRSAFHDCKSLTNVAIGKGVTEIPEQCFYGCESLTSITIPDNVTTIEGRAFAYCTSLSSVTIGSGVTRIVVQTFDSTPSLTSITIPASVTYIDMFAFQVGGGIRPELTVYGVPGSAAEELCKSINKLGSMFNYKFIAIGGETTPQNPPTTTENPSSWAAEQVNAAIAANLVPQDLQAKYTQATTRAEFAALAVALYETVTGAEITGRTKFNDTTDVNVEKAAAIGVVNGVGDNNFSPNTGLTREQAATMLARLANAVGKPLTQQAAAFNDNGSISAYALEAIGQMQATGIMGGVGNNTFSPKGAYTREQSIVTILRLYDIVK